MQSYYSSLIAAWNSDTQPPEGVIGAPLDADMSPQQKIDTISTWSVVGPRRDVPVSEVSAELLLSGTMVYLLAFAEEAVNGDSTHDAALIVAKTFLAWIGLGANAPIVQCSDPDTYTKIVGMMSALAAQEAAQAGSSGMTDSIKDAVLALAETTVPWWQSVGFESPPCLGDAIAAGLS